MYSALAPTAASTAVSITASSVLLSAPFATFAAVSDTVFPACGSILASPFSAFSPALAKPLSAVFDPC